MEEPLEESSPRRCADNGRGGQCTDRGSHQENSSALRAPFMARMGVRMSCKFPNLTISEPGRSVEPTGTANSRDARARACPQTDRRRARHLVEYCEVAPAEHPAQDQDTFEPGCHLSSQTLVPNGARADAGGLFRPGGAAPHPPIRNLLGARGGGAGYRAGRKCTRAASENRISISRL